MAVEVGSAYVSIVPSFSGFGRQVTQEVGDHGTRAGKQFGEQMSGGAMGAVAGLGKKLLGAAAIVEGFSFVKGLVDDARESAKVASITANTIRSTGAAAKITASQVGDLAGAISAKTGADDEAIQSGQNLLLTFTGIQNQAGKGNDVFNQASSTLVDMTAAMNNGSVSSEAMKSTAIQLGKALNDPAKGMTALTRVGVTFTDEQKNQITAMQKAGDTAGAQKIILAELNREFGGTAAAASNPMQKLGVIIGNVREELGSYLLPIVDKFANWLGQRVIPYLSALASQYGPKVAQVFGLIGDGLKTAWNFAEPLVGGLFTGIKDLVSSISGGVASPGWVKAIESVKAIGGDVIGTLSTVGGIVKDLFSGAAGQGDFAKNFTGIKDAISGVFDTVQGYYQKVIPIVREIVDAITSKFRDIAPKIRPILKTVLDVIKSVFETIQVIVKVATGIILWVWDTFGKDILKFITGAFDPVVKVISGVFNVIKGIFDVVLGVLTGNWGRAWNGIKEIFGGVWDAVVGVLQLGWNTITFVVNAIIDVFVGLWDALFGHSIITDIVAAFGVAWDLIKAAFEFLSTAIGVIWNTILKPVFDAIAVVAVWLWDNVLSPIFTVIKAGWDLLVAGLTWAWNNIGKPMFEVIASVVSWLWNNALSVIFAAIKVGWNLLLAGLSAVWNSVLKPVFEGVATVAQWLWNNILSPTWNLIKAGWNLLVDGIKAVWNNVLKPVFDTVASVVQTVADKVGKAFDGVGDFFSKAWDKAVGAVKSGWNTIANWVNDHVIKKVNDLFSINLPVLVTFSEGGAVNVTGARGLASGGHIRGPGTSTSDSILARLSDGEFVLNAAAVQRIGVGTLNALNHDGRLVNLGPGGDAGGAHFGLPGFADGGSVGRAKDWIRAQAGKPYSMGAVGPGAYDCSGLVGAVWALLNGKNPNARYFSTVNEAGFFKPGLGGPHAFNVGFYGGGGASGHTAGQLDGLYFEATPPHVLVGSTNYKPESGLFTSKGHLDVGTGLGGGGGGVWGWLYDHTIGEVKGALADAVGGLSKAVTMPGMFGDMLRSMASKAIKSLSFDGGGLLPKGQWLVDHNANEPDRVLSASQWKVAESAMARANTGPAIEVHVHPRADQDEAAIAAVVSRELAWLMK